MLKRIFEGQNVLLLFNFKPISSRDFLIVAKPHIKQFNEPVFIEMMALAKRVCDVYEQKGYKARYIKFADSKAAGKTVEHSHIQVTIGRDWQEEAVAILTVVRKIVFDSWASMLVPSLFRLSDRELQKKISQVKVEMGITNVL